MQIIINESLKLGYIESEGTAAKHLFNRCITETTSFKSILSHNGPKDLNGVNVPFSGARKRFRGTGLWKIHLIAYIVGNYMKPDLLCIELA